MRLRLFVICYGAAHADLYERVAIRSLTQPRNLTALKAYNVTVALYSDAETMLRVQALSCQLGTPEPHILNQGGNHYDTQNQAFIDEVFACAASPDTACIIVNPDCFWGDGSLANLLAIAGEQDVCIAAAHVRVDREGFLHFLGHMALEIENPQLVTLGLYYLHQSWQDARTSMAKSNSYYTGISIRHINPSIYSVIPKDDLYAVHHLLPTIWYARLTMADYAFFKERPHARGVWDHAWPATLGGRQRTIASSDAFFVAELTDARTHNTGLREVDPKALDAYHAEGPHIRANRGVVSVWRAG